MVGGMNDNQKERAPRRSYDNIDQKIQRNFESANARAEYNKSMNIREVPISEVDWRDENVDGFFRRLSFLYFLRGEYERALIRGDEEKASAFLNAAKERGFKLLNSGSRTGIPDITVIPDEEAREDFNIYPVEEYPDCKTCRELERAHFYEGIPTHYQSRGCMKEEDFLNVPGAGQPLRGSCNQRELNATMFAARLNNMDLSSFVTNATLYMAHFITRYRKDERESAYTPGEGYLFMEHGARMQDAFKPEEVAQAMDVAGITASQAVKLMAELERLRDARMNPEAGSMDVPE